MKDTLRDEALRYHQSPTPGKISIAPTKPLGSQRDLALAYSPGVAAACEEIVKNPITAYEYTSRGNMVAVITNGTAVLGLGNIGPLAAKPVMEGKSVLFKKFANIDSIDIEIQETDIEKFVETVASMEPSFGGINLEDIKAPECFEIERRLRERMNIPVFHDDQHGTAIIVSAAFLNWLHFTGKKAEDVKLVCVGAGAAAIACLNLLTHCGLKKENIIVCDRKGVIYKGREENMVPEKANYASDTKSRNVGEALNGANILLGLSGPGNVTKEMIGNMEGDPLIMALANPVPEIMPEEAREVKPGAIVCTGRSDYPNQVNNVLCFPFIFRGALDVGATVINEEMKLACVKAIAKLARREASAEVASAYSNEKLHFGAEYLIPKPLDPRLIMELPIAVAKAAMESGVATRPLKDESSYIQVLQNYFFRTQLVMKPVYERANNNPKRVVYCEAEEERVLRAIQAIIDEGIAEPILIGRRRVIETRIKEFGLRIDIKKDVQLVDPEDDPRYHDYWTTYHEIMERKGVTPDYAKTVLHTNTTVIGALMVYKGEADAVICGAVGQYKSHLKDITDIIGLKEGVSTAAAMNAVVIQGGTYFFCDTQININPDEEQITEMTQLAAEEIKRFGISPRVALLSHSNFGSQNGENAQKMGKVCAMLKERNPELEVDGEMQADTALCDEIRKNIMPGSDLTGPANLLIMPDIESASIAYNIIKVLGEGISIGPLLLGAAKPAHIITHAVTPRGIINITALASATAQMQDEQK